ncbi:MAG: sulfotransferase domain-containing protein [Litoreibacter sp.]
MPKLAQQLYQAQTSYKGALTRPALWDAWHPNEGDIILCTPAKCGTTWTQTIITMLLYGTTDLPDRVSALSPWLDSALKDAKHITRSVGSPTGRRLIKTHTPADGFPIWNGVQLVAVYRHPLDVFLSIRSHVTNMKGVQNPDLCGPVPDALNYYLEGSFNADDIDRDYLSSFVHHYLHTINRPHQDDLILLHYANMVADPRHAVKELAVRLELDHDDVLIDAITNATHFNAMKAQASKFAPEGGNGVWHKDAAFFDSGGTLKWQRRISEKSVALFERRLRALLPKREHSNWVKFGT